jgi:hypothetical protein
LIEKYGESIADEFPDHFKGLNLKKGKKAPKPE